MSIMRDDLPGAPSALVGEGPHRWTVHTSSRSLTYITWDRGETWEVEQVVWGEERARRDRQAIEQHDIQRELK